MRNVIRGIVGLTAVFNILLGIAFLIDPARLGARFFLSSVGTQGLATMRADFTAFFLTGGVFALVGAWRAQRAPLLVPLSLLGIAISGRAISLVTFGASAEALSPIAAEAVMIAILALGWRSFDRENGR